MNKYFGILCIATLLIACNKDESDVVVPDQLDQKLLVNLVNEVRNSGCNCGDEEMPPVGDISWNNQLEEVAEKHSLYMYTEDTLSHIGLNNSTISDRITASGYQWSSVGENIAWYFPNETEVVQAWINSPGHCKNIMNETFTEMGLAKVGEYWTQVFAKPLK
ncbi:MAG: CAP domain-containing protein [Prolixibacteraceae bacterium]